MSRPDPPLARGLFKLQASDAEWLPHRYDASCDQVQFRHVPRARHAEVPFLTDDCLGISDDMVPMALSEALAAAPGGKIAFVFHSAFCASTLLARAFDLPGTAMGLSEPVILNDIAGIRRRGAPPRDVARMLDGAMRLLARPFEAGETVVVKPSNVLNPLASGMLTIRPEASAVLLHAPLPVFLASVARKGMWCRLWARELLEGLLADGVVDLGMEPRDHFRQTDLQVAAVGWLAQQAILSAMCAKYGASRVRTLDSETLLARPREVLGAMSRHFAIIAGEEQLTAMATGAAFGRHSKSGVAFSATDRAAEQRLAAQVYGDEISKVTVWAEAVAVNSGIPLILPHPLLD